MFENRQKPDTARGELFAANLVVEIESALAALRSDPSLHSEQRQQVEEALGELSRCGGSGKFFKPGFENRGVLNTAVFQALVHAAEAFEEAGRPDLRKQVWNVLAQNLVVESISLLEARGHTFESGMLAFRYHYIISDSESLSPEFRSTLKSITRNHLSTGDVLDAHLKLAEYTHELNYNGDLELALALSGLEDER